MKNTYKIISREKSCSCKNFKIALKKILKSGDNLSYILDTKNDIAYTYNDIIKIPNKEDFAHWLNIVSNIQDYNPMFITKLLKNSGWYTKSNVKYSKEIDISSEGNNKTVVFYYDNKIIYKYKIMFGEFIKQKVFNDNCVRCKSNYRKIQILNESLFNICTFINPKKCIILEEFIKYSYFKTFLLQFSLILYNKVFKNFKSI